MSEKLLHFIHKKSAGIGIEHTFIAHTELEETLFSACSLYCKVVIQRKMGLPTTKFQVQ